MTSLAADPVAAPQAVSGRAPSRFAWLRERGMGASILVALLATAFGVFLVEVTAYIGALLRADPYIGNSGTLAVVVGILTFLLAGVAIYVAAIVTANTFSTIIAGRTRRIALMRLIGASARSQRTEVANQGAIIGIIGAVLGVSVGLGISAVGVSIGEHLLPGAPEFSLALPSIAVPAAGVILTTWLAAWIGSRRVLTVTPLQAIGGSVDRTSEDVAQRSGRHVGALILGIIGVALLVFGILVGLVTPLGVVIAFFGGIFSFTGLVLAAERIMPPVLRLVGRLFGRSAPARLAAENALRYPERSSRMAIGVVVGVMLVTMFAVALASVKTMMISSWRGDPPAEFIAILDGFSAVMMVLVGISAVIAGVGLVNLLTIGVVQRRRELGLLRAIGLSNAQVRSMVLLEAVQITVAATLSGLAFGLFYGWAAAQSLLGAVSPAGDGNPAGFFWPTVPWLPMAVIAVGAAVLTLLAAAAPTRLATRVAPVEALAAD